MGTRCEDTKFNWAYAPSWLMMTGLNHCNADEILKDNPKLKEFYNEIEKAAITKGSVINRLYKLLGNDKRAKRVFLHPDQQILQFSKTKETKLLTNFNLDLGMANLVAGMHLYVGEASLDSEGKKIWISEIYKGTFVHEMWHMIISQAKWKEGPVEASWDFVDEWTDPEKKEGAFEEAFATMLAVLSMDCKSKYYGDGVHESFCNGHSYIFTHKEESKVVIGAMDCLFPMAESNPRMWMAMTKTVLRYTKDYKDEMDLKKFVEHFKKDYPYASSLMPKACMLAK